MDHQILDRRSLSLAEAVVARIDAEPGRLEKVRAWARRFSTPALQEWQEILRGSWPEIREVLLRPDAEGQRLRQNSPFVGILTPQERWSIYRDSKPT